MFSSCTAVRIPTARAHSESIVALFEKPVDVAAARKALEEATGVKLVDDVDNMKYPMPLTATGQYDIEVGRLRENIAFDNALEFFVCGDQLLRGAALNAVIVAEAMVENGALQAKAVAQILSKLFQSVNSYTVINLERLVRLGIDTQILCL